MISPPSGPSGLYAKPGSASRKTFLWWDSMTFGTLPTTCPVSLPCVSLCARWEKSRRRPWWIALKAERRTAGKSRSSRNWWFGSQPAKRGEAAGIPLADVHEVFRRGIRASAGSFELTVSSRKAADRVWKVLHSDRSRTGGVMLETTRRDFLKIGAGVVASRATCGTVPLWASSESRVRAWVTSRNRRFEEIEALRWRISSSNSLTAIHVDPGQRKQEILGFGAALTDASCYLFYKLNSQEREALVSELFGPAGPRFSVVRTCIGASDYSTEGVRINAVTVQNEVDTDQDGRMPAALWGPEYEIEFVKNYLGPAFEHASLDAKIWILDQNWNLWGRVVDELSDPAVNKCVDGIAWHGYGGAPDAMTRVHEAFPTKHSYWTEGGPDITSPDYAMDWAKWSHTFTEVLRNWARCIVGWNLLLDEKGLPNIGPFHCGGVVT